MLEELLAAYRLQDDFRIGQTIIATDIEHVQQESGHKRIIMYGRFDVDAVEYLSAVR